LTASSLGGASLPFKVLLPANYGRSARRYPVLYLLHGAYGNENDWTTRTNLVSYVEPYHLIVVMPGVGNSWYANSASDERARYEDALMRDLIPHIDAKYRTLSSGYGRAVAGLSMGGFGAMKFALRYPQQFAFAASFSGAFDAPRTNIVSSNANEEYAQIMRRVFGSMESETRRQNDLFRLLGATDVRARLPYLYVSTGSGDPLASVLPSNPRFADALRERGVAYEYHERPGLHDWRFWDEEIKLALERMSEIVRHMRR
jgi:S-formylglutathione hydrolase FrmB